MSRGATDVVAAQRSTIRSLVGTQAVGAVGITIGIATASLLARDLSGSEKMAGLAQTSQVLGASICSFVLARLMSARGRRTGLATGYLLGAAGAVLCVVAGKAGSMSLLLAGAVLLGSTTAANSAARYAATDLAEDAHRARALAVVVWATTIGAVAGPNLTGPAARLAGTLDLPALTGPFAIGAIGMLAAAVLVFATLRPDPLLLARELAGEAPGEHQRGRSWQRAVEVLRTRPAVAAGVTALALAHAAMVSVMVMTPLHMEHGGSELRVIGVVISVHVLGMFAFSPLVGIAADRFGRAASIACGAALLLLAAALSGGSPEGSSWQIFAGLFLLGLGWSFATVAASALLTEHTPLAARTDVQGTADMTMNLTAAGGGGLAGLIVGEWGYGWLNLFAAVLALGVAASAAVAARPRQPKPPVPAPSG